MTRLASFAAWLFGAAVSALAHWYVVVYLLDAFNAGYGRDNWFLLNLYLSAIAVVAGLIGYAAASFLTQPPRAFLGACVAGIAFTAAALVLGTILSRAYPDQDVLAQQLGGALVIGALSVLVRRPLAARISPRDEA